MGTQPPTSSAAGARPKILLLNGPNLNLLGERQPEIYGADTLPQIEIRIRVEADALGFDFDAFQSNHEGAMIDAIQAARHSTVGLIINPGAYGHTSVALRDALLIYPHPAIEVHLTNLARREDFRHETYISAVVTGSIVGLGAQGYSLALLALHRQLTQD